MSDRLLLDVRRAAEMLTMSTRSLERLTASGDLPSVKVGGLRRYRLSDLLTFVAGLGEDNGAATGLIPAAAHTGGHGHGRRRSTA